MGVKIFQNGAWEEKAGNKSIHKWMGADCSAYLFRCEEGICEVKNGYCELHDAFVIGRFQVNMLSEIAASASDSARMIGSLGNKISDYLELNGYGLNSRLAVITTMECYSGISKKHIENGYQLIWRPDTLEVGLYSSTTIPKGFSFYVSFIVPLTDNAYTSIIH